MLKYALMMLAMGFAGFLCALLLERSGMKLIAEQITPVSAGLFLSSYLVLLLLGLVLFIKSISQQISNYLSSQAGLERKATFYKNKLRQQQLIFEFKKAKILYLAQKKRNTLLKKWSKQTLI